MRATNSRQRLAFTSEVGVWFRNRKAFWVFDPVLWVRLTVEEIKPIRVKMCAIASNRRLATAAALSAFGFVLSLVVVPGPCNGQASALQSGSALLTANDFVSGVGSGPGSADYLTCADSQSQSSSSTQSTASVDNTNWQITVAPYLWFPGMHGTVGIAGRELRVNASAIEILSHFRFGFMGAVEFRRKRLVLPMDAMWVRLEDDKPLPLDAMVTTGKFKAQQIILTSKIGLRVIDEEKVKIDALTGFRYWHLGESLTFDPSALGLSFSNSQNWVDPLVGGRIQLALAPKVAVNVLGDVGGWGTGAQIENQVVGLIGFRIKPTWNLQAGYRYMSVDYRSGGFLFDVITSGVMFGLTMNLK